MKVLYILNRTPRLSGSFKAFLAMLDGLKGMGVEPLLVVPRDPVQDYAEYLRQRGESVTLMRFRMHTYPNSRTWSQKLLFLPRLLAALCVNYVAEIRLAKMFEGKGIQLVHTNVGLLNLGWRVARRLGVPHVQHIREFGERQFPTREAFIRRMQRPDSYSICITKAVQRNFHLEGTSTSRVIYDGVHSHEGQLPWKESLGNLLFVGMVHPSKGMDQVVDAYCLYAHLQKQAGRPVLPLKVAGSIPDKTFWASLISQLKSEGLEENVTFLGARSDVESLMRDANAVVVASPVEGFGLCMPEAMFCGTLVIGRNVSGTREQMDNGFSLTGQEIALRYDSAEELARCFRQVTECYADYDAMRQRAFCVVNELYTHEEHVRRVFDFYKKIIRE